MFRGTIKGCQRVTVRLKPRKRQTTSENSKDVAGAPTRSRFAPLRQCYGLPLIATRQRFFNQPRESAGHLIMPPCVFERTSNLVSGRRPWTGFLACPGAESHAAPSGLPVRKCVSSGCLVGRSYAPTDRPTARTQAVAIGKTFWLTRRAHALIAQRLFCGKQARERFG